MSPNDCDLSFVSSSLPQLGLKNVVLGGCVAKTHLYVNIHPVNVHVHNPIREAHVRECKLLNRGFARCVRGRTKLQIIFPGKKLK